jgi:hypothetical protein
MLYVLLITCRILVVFGAISLVWLIHILHECESDRAVDDGASHCF